MAEKDVTEKILESYNDVFSDIVNDYRINLFEIAYLSNEQVNLFTSDFRIVADYFVQKRENGDYIPNTWEIRHVLELGRMDDVRRISEDRDYRHKLMKELMIG